MSKLYRFPHLRRFDGLCPLDYRNKIDEECTEVIDEFYEARNGCRCGYLDGEGCDFKASDALILEVMDLIQACETFLRNSGREEGELIALMEMHNLKDAMRGYKG